jgi:formylglycine-generating enzyme required for sulfatase activity
MSDFDAYHKWLGIPRRDQPPNHYRLLAIELFESDTDVIEDAAEQRTAHVRNYQLGKHVELSQKILNEIAAAKICLLNAEHKAVYDETLRNRLAPPPQPPTAPPPAPPVAPAPRTGDLDFLSAPAAVPATAVKSIPYVTSRPKKFPERKRVGPALGTLGAAVLAMLVVLAVIYWSREEFGVPGSATPPNATGQAGKKPVATEAARVAPVPRPKPAEYDVTIEPPDARLTAGGKGVTVSGEGALRTVEIAEPDGQTKVVLLATKTGYKTLEKDIEPQPGELRRLALALELLPAPKPKPEPPKPAQFTVTIDPPDARLSAGGRGVTVNGDGALRTVVVAEPDGETKVLLSAARSGYQTLEKEIQPKPGESERLALTLEPQPKPAPRRGTALAEQLTNSIGMKLTLIPPGEFLMGSRESSAELARMFAQFEARPEIFDREHPQHRVRITRPFYLGVHHVTVGQFRQFVSGTGYRTDAERGTGTTGKGATGKRAVGKAVMGKGAIGLDGATGKYVFKAGYSWRNPGFQQTDEHPVVCVSWNDAMAFCRWLSGKEGKPYRLPTEAEWEYACRAGTTTQFWCGNDPEGLAQVANVPDATAKAKLNLKFTIRASDGYAFTSPVGSFRPNPLGLYDMLGNVWDWCANWYGKDYYAASPADDPTGPDSGAIRILRGGSWGSRPHDARSAFRGGNTPDHRDIVAGFRVARTQ